ncbi:hypothetical protein RRG08_008093 [Elysia crispata]|uniref:Uncharacterized protein n=1 Tax=Elysia crispata TaxID=231223 RepID=A0AAE1CVE8_9GAST|nr:hypothetical protein RRG08_008093 [Elysia crispata]
MFTAGGDSDYSLYELFPTVGSSRSRSADRIFVCVINDLNDCRFIFSPVIHMPSGKPSPPPPHRARGRRKESVGHPPLILQVARALDQLATASAPDRSVDT